jgi:excisionase family DNA binding protein
MTVREVAELLRVEKKKIYEMVARDQLPGARRLGRLIRVSRAAVLRWLDAR